MTFDTQETLQLPEPRLKGVLSVESALQLRRSVRAFSTEALALSEVAQILWAAQGISDKRPERFRTAPSAGALHPLQVILLAGQVDDLAPGIYRYLPEEHALTPLAKGDRRTILAKATLAQDWIADAACILALAGTYARTTGKYGERGRRYVHMEVGHVGQNVYLQASALGLGTTMVGAFRDQELQRVLGLEPDESPLALLPIGHLR